MRDYVKAWVIDVSAHDSMNPDNTFFNRYCATSEKEAAAVAATVVSQLSGLGYDTVDNVQWYPLYMLLSKGLILANFTPAGDTTDERGLRWANLTIQNAQAFGVSPYYSPKEQGVRPWNGKKR